MNWKDMNWQDAVTKWKNDDLVYTVEMGGVGPGYEQALQILVFEIMRRWPKSHIDMPNFDEHVDDVARKLDLGFSGAQVSAARHLAYHFMFDGYADVIAKVPEDRRIMVSRNFPQWEM